MDKSSRAEMFDREIVDPLKTPASSLNEDDRLLVTIFSLPSSACFSGCLLLLIGLFSSRARLGYKPVLHRTFALIDNFSAAFAALYFVGGVRVTFSYGISYGGTLAYWTSYLITCFFTFVTASVLAEICSALPAAGSIYFWAAECAGPNYGRLAGFIVAWWSTTAWTTFVASLGQSAANYLLSELPIFNSSFSTDTSQIKFRAVQWIVAEGLLALAMSVQYLPPKYYRWVFRSATAIVLLDFFLNLIWLPIAVSKTYGFRSAEFAFLTENDISGFPKGWDWCLSFFSTAGILVGYDASGHVAEETKGASRNAAKGLFWSAMTSAILGFVVVVLFLFCAPATLPSATDFPQPFVAVYAQAMGQGGHVFMNVVCILGLVLNASVSVVAASRLVFAVARDGVLPFSGWIAQVDKYGNPRNAQTVVWVVASVLLLTILPSQVAFTSLVSAAGVPTFAAYALIATCRFFITPQKFRDGKWRLGMFSRPLNALAIPFNWFCVAVLVSPYYLPVNGQTLNYAGVILGAITIFGFISWWVVPESRWLEKKRLLAVNQAAAEHADSIDQDPLKY